MNKPDNVISEINQNDSHSRVQSLLESVTKRELTAPQLIAELTKHCRRNTDATWQTLALVDQYFRRGRIDHDVYSQLKQELNALVFGPLTKTNVPSQAHQGNADNPIARSKEQRVSRQPITAQNHAPLPRQTAKHPAREQAAQVSIPLPSASKHSSTTSAQSNVSDQRAALVDPAPTAKLLSLGARISIVMVVSVLLILGWRVFLIFQSVPAKTELTKQLSANEPLLVAPANTAATQASSSAPTPPPAPLLTSMEQNTSQAPLPAAEAAAVTTASNEALSTAGLVFVEDPLVVNHDESVAHLTVRRTDSVWKELTVHWRTIEGSAKANQDFAPTEDGVLLFARRARTADIVIPIVQRADRKHSDWFEVELFTKVADATVQPTTLRATVSIAGPLTDTDDEREDATTQSTIAQEN
jgi:hypothetical protein